MLLSSCRFSPSLSTAFKAAQKQRSLLDANTDAHQPNIHPKPFGPLLFRVMCKNSVRRRECEVGTQLRALERIDGVQKHCAIDGIVEVDRTQKAAAPTPPQEGFVEMFCRAAFGGNTPRRLSNSIY
jgi:hypothetical protein